ncbi:MAG: polysaccharide biosynthesis/export family protein [Pseudomonadota bacterium]
MVSFNLTKMRAALVAVQLIIAAAIAAAPTGVWAQNYLLKPGDVVEISVLEDPALNRQALIGPDGRISLPLAGILTVGGRSLGQVQAAVRNRIQKEFVQPVTVTAALISVAPDVEDEELEEDEVEVITIYVLGEVQRPGRIDVDGEKPVTVLQALSLAGGLGPFAARKRIQIRRTVEDEETVSFFDYDAIEDDSGPQPLFTLGDGDVIIAPERSLFD